MSLIKWQPFGDFDDAFNRLMPSLLNRFPRGPMEHLWRVLTYGRAALQPTALPSGEPTAYRDDRPRASSPN